MKVDKIWKLTKVVRVRLAARSSHSQRQATFPDNVCSYSPPCHGVSVESRSALDQNTSWVIVGYPR